MNRSSAKRGFTIIEVMITMVVFMIALLGLAAMQRASAVGSDMAHKHTAGVNIARFFMTRLQNELATWPENRHATSANFPWTDSPMLYRAASVNPNLWHLLPGNQDGDVSDNFRLDRFLGHSANNLEPTSSYCVHYRVQPMDIPAGGQIQNALVWRLHVRVAWPKHKQYGATPTGSDGWMNCDPATTMYVGDSLVDFEAAEAAGMEPVIIRRDGFGDVRQSEVDALIAAEGESGRFRVIDNLYELVEISNGV